MENPQKLLLKYSGREPESTWSVWLAGERKLSSKIPLDWFERGWICPNPISAEQCTPWGIASAIDWGTSGRALDLCAGLGVDSAALAMSGMRLRAIEANPVLSEALKHNFKVLELEVEVVQSLAEDYVESVQNEHFELIYADPDRRPGKKKILSLEDSRPDPVSSWARWMALADRIILKISPMYDPHEALRRLGSTGIEAIEAWSLNSELKELLIRYSSQNQKDTQIRAFMKSPSGRIRSLEDSLVRRESAPLPLAGSIVAGMYIGDPEPALHKLNLYARLSEQFPEGGWISRNTHLMVFEKAPIDFPGDVYVLERAFDRKLDQSSALEPLLRNFPERAETLRKQHRLKPGSTHRLIGFRNQSHRTELWIARSGC